jgi:hypothetical protein
MVTMAILHMVRRGSNPLSLKFVLKTDIFCPSLLMPCYPRREGRVAGHTYNLIQCIKLLASPFP